MTLLLALACATSAPPAEAPPGLAAAASPRHAATPHPERPNVLLVDIDTLSGNRFDARYGDEWAMPTVHALASRGVAFTQAISQSGWTVPALASLLTGRYPISLDLSQATTSVYEGDARLLPQLFSLYGYADSAIWSTGVPQLMAALEGGFRSSVTRAEPVGGDPDPGATHDQWLASSPKEPFFLLLHEYDLQIPGPRFGIQNAHHFGDDGLLCYPGEYEEVFHALAPVVGEEKARAHTLRHYDGAIFAYDQLLGTFLAKLDERGLLENTIVVVTSNHGQDFAEHTSGVTHGSLFDTVLHVPLIMAGPGITAHGAVVDTPVQTIDVAPTLLDLANIPVDRQMVGRSLVPLLTGEPPAADMADRPVFSLTNDRTMSVRSGHRKLLIQDWSDHQVALSRTVVDTPETDRTVTWYDLATDPGEKHDLFATRPEEALDLLQALLRFRAGRLEAAGQGTTITVDASMRKMMQQNGYWSIVDGSQDAGASQPAPVAQPDQTPTERRRRPRNQRDRR